MKHFIIIILLMVLFISCKKCPDCPENVNHAPVVQDILSQPKPPLILPQSGGEVATWLTAIAVDEDGDSLSYAWDATSGRLLYHQLNQVRWEVDTPGLYDIICIANDGKATGSKTITATVTQ